MPLIQQHQSGQGILRLREIKPARQPDLQQAADIKQKSQSQHCARQLHPLDPADIFRQQPYETGHDCKLDLHGAANNRIQRKGGSGQQQNDPDGHENIVKSANQPESFTIICRPAGIRHALKQRTIAERNQIGGLIGADDPGVHRRRKVNLVGHRGPDNSLSRLSTMTWSLV